MCHRVRYGPLGGDTAIEILPPTATIACFHFDAPGALYCRKWTAGGRPWIRRHGRRWARFFSLRL